MKHVTFVAENQADYDKAKEYTNMMNNTGAAIANIVYLDGMACDVAACVAKMDTIDKSDNVTFLSCATPDACMLAAYATKMHKEIFYVIPPYGLTEEVEPV